MKDLFYIIDTLVQWVIAPVIAFVWVLFTRQHVHATDIAVLKNSVVSIKENHDREIREIRNTTDRIFQKLNSIEETLRK